MRHTGRFDDRCPTCSEKVELYDAFISKDYRSDFETTCPHCGELLEVYVHAVPEFEVFTKEQRLPAHLRKESGE